MNLEGSREELRPSSQQTKSGLPVIPIEFAEWLHYWNDELSELGNLRELEHWLRQARTSKTPF